MKVIGIKIQDGIIFANPDESAKLSGFENGAFVEFDISTNVRSNTMSACLHMYLGTIAKLLADAGHDMRKVVKVPIVPTLENVKPNLFHPVMTSTYPDITSTTQLSNKQMSFVYDVFNSAIGARLGISADWPSHFNGGIIT